MISSQNKLFKNNRKEWGTYFKVHSGNSIIHKIRYSIYKKHFFENIMDKNSIILDVGCGTGDFMRYIEKRGYKNVYGVDPLETLYKKKRLHIKKGSVTKLPFKNNFFNYIYIFNVFHHLKSVKEYNVAINEISRCLKQNGLLLIIEPNNYLIYHSIYITTKIFKIFSKTVANYNKLLECEWKYLSLFLLNYHKFRENIKHNKFEIIKEKRFQGYLLHQVVLVFKKLKEGEKFL